VNPKFTKRILKFDSRVKSITTVFWEWVLKFSPIPRGKYPNVEFLSEADRIEEEPINQNYPVVMYTLIILLTVGFIWAALSPLDQVVSGTGRVISVEPNIILQAHENSEIKEVKIAIGQPVKKGDILFILDPTVPQADLAQTQGAYQGIVRGLEIALSEAQTIESRIQSARENEQMTKQLVEKNFQSKRALIEQTERRLALEQALLSVRARQNELLSQKNAMEQQLIKAKRRQEVIQIIAPRDGVILEVSPLSRGSVARATEPLVTLVPTDVPLMAEVSIDPSGISAVTTGQRAKIKLNSFPFQRHGYLEGTILTVTPDTVVGRDQSQGKSYVARIQFDKNEKSAELLARVIPGMTLVAEVLTDERTVLQYIFDPLLKIKMEAMNEKS